MTNHERAERLVSALKWSGINEFTAGRILAALDAVEDAARNNMRRHCFCHECAEALGEKVGPEDTE